MSACEMVGHDTDMPFCGGCGAPMRATPEQIAVRDRLVARWARVELIEAVLALRTRMET